MNKPIVSGRFDVDDIRKIREFNSLRHMAMSHAEIVEETRSAAAEIQRMLGKKPNGVVADANGAANMSKSVPSAF